MANTERFDELEALRKNVYHLYATGYLGEDSYQDIDNAIDKEVASMGINTSETDL